MNTAKPSTPSSNGGAADDLIEELARLMAESAQENSAPPASSAPSTPAAKPELAALNSPGQKTSPQNPEPASYQSAARSTLKPQAQRQSSTPAKKFTPARNFPHADNGQDPAFEAADKPVSAGVSFAGSASGLSAPAPLTPQIDTQKILQASSDPIADLINAQPAPENDAATEPKTLSGAAPVVKDQDADPQDGASQDDAYKDVKPRDSGVSDKKTDVQGRDKFRVPPVFGLSGRPGASSSPDLASTSPKASAFSTDPASSAVPDVTVPDVGAPDIGGRAGSAADRAKTDSAKTDSAKVTSSPDALDEIESLIGNAVRVDFSEDPATAKSSEQDPLPPAPKDKIDSAEDAILQAMAAIGKTAQENQENQEKLERQKNSGQSLSGNEFPDVLVAEDLSRISVEKDDLSASAQALGADKTANRRFSRFLIPMGAGIILIGAVFGGYWVLTSGPNNGDAPVLVADSAPSKQAPTPDQQNSGGQSGQFSDVADNANTVASADANANANERLVSRDQSTDVIGNEIRRVITADTTEAGLANRRVRTVTVRPDGTIISGDAAVAGGQVLPVARPDVPRLPANALNPELSNTTVAALPSPASANDASSAGSLASDVAPVAMIAPVPRPRPANRAALAATSNSTALDLISGNSAPASAPTPPAPIASTAPATPSNALVNPSAWVQMASRRSQDAATQSAASLQAKYTSIFGSSKLEVKRIDLGDRGIFYRVLLPTATLDEASSVCNAIKSAGGDCFTRTN
ncbi:hypothetical protein MNBD_ALPHA12-1852 [hydrothermal vent metagenome]|uniref:SPOR domain-containing protein n=1 Tax=hydrothermal vent metagenome TaxID=652676 RepID=A0A3B0TZS8_9ZZZZ